MRICYVADAQTVHAKRMVKYFADKGHTVDLISFRPGSRYEKIDVKIHCIGDYEPKGKTSFSTIASHLKMILRTRKLVKKIKPDILHALDLTGCGLHAALTGFHPFIATPFGSDVLIHPKKNHSC